MNSLGRIAWYNVRIIIHTHTLSTTGVPVDMHDLSMAQPWLHEHTYSLTDIYIYIYVYIIIVAIVNKMNYI